MKGLKKIKGKKMECLVHSLTLARQAEMWWGGGFNLWHVSISDKAILICSVGLIIEQSSKI